MAQEMIIDAFPDHIDNHVVLSEILFTLFNYCTQFVKDKKQSIINSLILQLGIKEDSNKDKIGQLLSETL
jgi:hypothetical protein